MALPHPEVCFSGKKDNLCKVQKIEEVNLHIINYLYIGSSSKCIQLFYTW